MTVKVQCDCGQRYSFDVEPVSGRMPTSVTCPVCDADGTAKANEFISQSSGPTNSPVRLSGPARQPISSSATSSAPQTCTAHKQKTGKFKRILFSLVWALVFFIGSLIMVLIAWRVYFALTGAPQQRPNESTIVWLGLTVALVPLLFGIVGAVLGIRGFLPGTRKNIV